jgi:hypothetical protein
MSLEEHAELNRIVLEEVGAGIKSREAREQVALFVIGKVINGYLVRKSICNAASSSCDESLRRCQLYLRSAPRVGLYFRYCLSFFKHHVLYFRLKNVTGLAFQEFVKRCIMKDFEIGAVICRQGDSCDFFYVLVDGQMMISQRSGHVDKTLGTIRSGASFGEFGIIRQTPRTATITSVTKCCVMMIDKCSFLEILHLSNPEMVRTKTSFLMKLPIFRSAPRITLEHLSHVMAVQHWKPYDFVYRRCQFSGFDERLLVVLSGNVDVFVEPFLSENELSQRETKHKSRLCTCYTTKTLQETHSTAKSWLPQAKERGRCVCERGVGSFLNLHCLFRSDCPDCCIISGSQGAMVLVIQKIDFLSIVDKGNSNQLFRILAEQSWDAMCHRRETVSRLSHSKFPFRELVGQSLLIARPFNDSNIFFLPMKKFLCGPRHRKYFPPLDLHQSSGEEQHFPISSPKNLSGFGKYLQQQPQLSSFCKSVSSLHSSEDIKKVSPRLSRTMQEANFWYPCALQYLHSQTISHKHDERGSRTKDCSSKYAATAGDPAPVLVESANNTDSASRCLKQDFDYFEEAWKFFSKNLKDVQSFLRRPARTAAAVPPPLHSNFAPRAPELPNGSRPLGVRGSRMIESARPTK